MDEADRVGTDRIIRRHGGYKKLKSFQTADRVQAARRGVQNIVEGSVMSATSLKMEMKLTSVARASLEELRRDCEDFLRHRGAEAWPPGDAGRQELIDRRCPTLSEVGS